jgi:glycosyltransferase involved in cell wall biosynthesis
MVIECASNPAAPHGEDGTFQGFQERAESLYRKSDLDGAMAAAARAIALVPQAAPSLLTRGHALLAAGRPVEARALYERALQSGIEDNDTLSVHTQRAQLSALLGDLTRTPGLPPGVLIAGPYLDTSGYAGMVRRFVQEWRAEAIPILLVCKMWGPPTELGPEFPPLSELDKPLAARIAVHFDLPDSVIPVPGIANLNFTMTEYSRVPESWVRRAAWHDRVVVPTRSSVDAWTASGLSPERIALCPLGCDPPEDYDAIPPYRMVALSGRPVDCFKTRVLSVTSGTVRKNLGGMLRAWARATRPADDAVLILKLGKGSNTDHIQKYFSHILEKNKLSLGEMAEIVLVLDNLSDRDIIGLTKASTHYWSMSCGEGWDIPMTQAGASGLQLIAPAHSAYLTYLTPDIAHLTPVTETDAEAVWPGTPARWWRPDEQAAAATLRALIDGSASSKSSAREHFQTHFRWRDAARRLAGICGEARKRKIESAA